MESRTNVLTPSRTDSKRIVGYLMYLASLGILAACAGLGYSGAYVPPQSGPTATLDVTSLHEGTEWRNQTIFRVPGAPQKHLCSSERLQVLAILNNDHQISNEKIPPKGSAPLRLAFMISPTDVSAYADQGKNFQSLQFQVPANGQAFRVMVNEFYMFARNKDDREEFCQPNVSFVPEAGRKYKMVIGPAECQVQFLSADAYGISQTESFQRLPPCAATGLIQSAWGRLIERYHAQGKQIPERLAIWGPRNRLERASELGALRTGQ